MRWVVRGSLSLQPIAFVDILQLRPVQTVSITESERRGRSQTYLVPIYSGVEHCNYCFIELVDSLGIVSGVEFPRVEDDVGLQRHDC